MSEEHVNSDAINALALEVDMEKAELENQIYDLKCEIGALRVKETAAEEFLAKGRAIKYGHAGMGDKFSAYTDLF